ncbi:MAG: hypothetical protein ACO1RT_07215 [Planctomycetaceae bacterium]
MLNRLLLVALMLLSWNSVRAAEPAVAGEWVYSFAELIEADGKAYKTSVSGKLKLTETGKFEQSRRIGGVLNAGKGDYTVAKNQIVLRYEDGSKSDRYRFVVGTHTDSAGTKFDALTLTSKSDDGSGFKYLLTKKSQ